MVNLFCNTKCQRSGKKNLILSLVKTLLLFIKYYKILYYIQNIISYRIYTLDVHLSVFFPYVNSELLKFRCKTLHSIALVACHWAVATSAFHSCATPLFDFVSPPRIAIPLFLPWELLFLWKDLCLVCSDA